VQICEEFKYIA